MLPRSEKQHKLESGETEMKKLRVFLAAATLASAFIVVGAGPASARCVGEPVNACVLICEVGNSNKYTADLFSFCEVW
jgi:hypothetical protein